MSIGLDATIRDEEGRPVGFVTVTGTDLAPEDFDAVLQRALHEAAEGREWTVEER